MNNETNLNDSNSRLLGIGETVYTGDFHRFQAGSDWTDWAEVKSSIGHIVSQDDVFNEFRRKLVVVKQTYSSGAARSASEGRGRFDLIPYEAMLSLARRYEIGAAIFGDRNWENGVPLSRILSSMRRHSMQINYDFSEDHVGAVLWNAAAFVTMAERMRAGILPRELDDIGYLNREENK
jgi:hypothetical protein